MVLSMAVPVCLKTLDELLLLTLCSPIAQSPSIHVGISPIPLVMLWKFRLVHIHQSNKAMVPGEGAQREPGW
ncbi:hypothetical protein EV361DRAFT_921727 [Lentinula raphanica]|nr:hypothetical protein EV361DRAFT_921727 [Lentinula raphanica]